MQGAVSGKTLIRALSTETLFYFEWLAEELYHAFIPHPRCHLHNLLTGDLRAIRSSRDLARFLSVQPLYSNR